MLEKILVVVVLYKTSIKNSKTLQSINAFLNMQSGLEVFLYDNSPIALSCDEYVDLPIKYIHDVDNGGISRGYNIAANYALGTKKEFLLLLDQDSYLPTNFFDILKTSIIQNPEIDLFAPKLIMDKVILSPCRFKYGKGSAFSVLESGITSLKDLSIFNSGIAIRTASFMRSGGYEESIKLDFSDHYFIWKFKKIRKEFFLMPVDVEHEFSSRSEDVLKIYSRFIQYCDGINAYRRLTGNHFQLLFWTLLRALKLSIQFRTPKFLGTFISKLSH